MQFPASIAAWMKPAPAASPLLFGKSNPGNQRGTLFDAPVTDQLALGARASYPAVSFFRHDPNLPLKTIGLQNLKPEQLVFLVEAYGIRSANNPDGIISRKELDRLADRDLRAAIESPFELDDSGYAYNTRLSELAGKLSANRQLFTSQSYTVSAGGTLVPAEQAHRAFRIGMPWEMSFDQWYQNVTLYAPLSPYKLQEAMRGVKGLKGRIPRIEVPERVNPADQMDSEDTHQYQLKTVKDLQRTYDYFMRQDPAVQQQILKNLPWFTNTHSAWHQMSYATGKDGEYLERIFPGHFWLGMTRLPMFAISVPRPVLEQLHQGGQIALEDSHPGIDQFDYYGIPDPKVPNLSRGDRYITRTLAEGEMLADNPPPHPVAKPRFEPVKPPYPVSSFTYNNDKTALDRLNGRLVRTRSVKPILSYEELERSVTGQVIRVNPAQPADRQGHAARAELDRSFLNWQHMTVRDYWHTSYHLDMNNSIEPGKPVRDWHITDKECDEWEPCENAQGCDIPIPRRRGNGGINLNESPGGYYVWPNPQMWDILTYHAFNTFDVENRNPDYMYSGLLGDLSPQQKTFLKAKLGYLIQANLGYWRNDRMPAEARKSVQQLLRDPEITRFFPPKSPRSGGGGTLPTANVYAGGSHLVIDAQDNGFYIPVVTMLQYVPHGSENNNPLHHGGPPA